MDIMGRKKIWFILSGMLIFISILAISLWGLNLGLDFTGGVLVEIKTPKTADVSVVRDIAKSNGVEVIISSTGDKTILIRAKELSNDKKATLEKSVSEKYGKVEETSYRNVGPTISGQFSIKTILLALIAPLRWMGLVKASGSNIQSAVDGISWASFFIILFVAYAFRRVSRQISSWKFGICAVIAHLHDVLIVIGLFAILGHFLKIEVDSMFVTAILTVIGFSVHDTIVIYDRIRENLRKTGETDLDEVANQSILEMLPRDIATSFVIILVLLSLYFLGGETTKYFALAITVGMFFGTYSSIFVASALAVAWQKWGDKRKAASRS